MNSELWVGPTYFRKHNRTIPERVTLESSTSAYGEDSAVLEDFDEVPAEVTVDPECMVDTDGYNYFRPIHNYDEDPEPPERHPLREARSEQSTGAPVMDDPEATDLFGDFDEDTVGTGKGAPHGGFELGYYSLVY